MATKQHTTISRRAALAGGASVAALTGVATVAVAVKAHEHPDAGLLRLCDAFWRIHDERLPVQRQIDAAFRAADVTHPQPEGNHMELWFGQDPEYCRLHIARQDELRRLGVNDCEERLNEIGDREWPAAMTVIAHRAVTFEGMRAKIKVSLANVAMTMEELEGGDPDARTLASIIHDLDGLQGGVS